MSSTCLHNMENFDPLVAEIGSGLWGIPANFSGLVFITAVTSLTGGEPNFARCLAICWAGTLYIHFWGLLAPERILPGAKFTLRPSLVFAYIGSITARHSSSMCLAKLCGVMQGMELRNFCRQRHLYLAGQPSRWASAHILVCSWFYFVENISVITLYSQ